jgi:hypothetical protein
MESKTGAGTVRQRKGSEVGDASGLFNLTVLYNLFPKRLEQKVSFRNYFRPTTSSREHG